MGGGGPCIVRAPYYLPADMPSSDIRPFSILLIFPYSSVHPSFFLLGDPQLVVEVPHAVEAAEDGREQPRRQRPVVEGRRPEGPFTNDVS